MTQAATTPTTQIQRLLIRASAGTGKTFQLSSRYISLLRSSSPEKILASTFTRKAAGEILERVLLRLSHAVLDEKALQVLADSVGPPQLTRDECRSLLARLTRQLHRVRISTLDSFFSQLAGSYALELGMPPGWRVLDPLEIDQIRTSSIEEMLSTGAPQDLVQLMHLLDKGQSSRNISRLITETIGNLYYVFLSAPDESWERFPSHPFLPSEQRELLRGMIEAVPLDKVSLTKARDQDVEAITFEYWDGLLKRGLMPKIISGEMKYSRVAIPESLRGPYEELYQHVLAHVAEPWKNQTLAARQLLRDYHACFERSKMIAGGMEFGDVTRRLANSQQQSRLVEATFRLDASIDHLLLDEFQDTSPEQWSVIRSIAEETCRQPGRSFFCVGDPKQAIYGWRGGEAALFDLISEELPSIETVELNQSFRSSPVIMETVNVAMRQLSKHDNLEDHDDVLYQWTKRFPEHRTARTDLTGYACLRTMSEKVDEATPFGEEESHPPEYWTEVAQYVRDRHREAPGASIGILTRKNPTVGRLIFELTQHGIDASEEGGNPLTDSAAVQLILSLFTLADHPGHTIAAFHVANSPLGPILNFTHAGNAGVRVAFAAAFRQRLIDHGYGGVVHELLPQLAPFCNKREYQRLIQLTDFADRYDAMMADLRPSGFVEFISQQRREEPTSAPVRVMTIHQSKGLEFDIVILPELDAQLYLSPKYVSRSPSPGAKPDLVALYRSTEHFESLGGDLLDARQATRDRMFQEALCLLYVALTRAVRSLHLLINPKVSKKLPKTFAGLLRGALATDVPIVPQTTLWETGNPTWFRDDPKMLTAKSKVAQEEVAPRVITFGPPSSRTHWKRQSPTGRKKPEEVSLDKELTPVRSLALTKGTLFHRWMEEVEWLDIDAPNSQRLLNLAMQAGVPTEIATDWIGQFNSMISSDWCRLLLNRGSYQTAQSCLPVDIQEQLRAGNATLTVRHECPFTIRSADDELLSGFIDRLVIVEQDGRPIAADVIDYKTDDLSGGDQILTERTESYRVQMQSYRQAVVELSQLDPKTVSVRLVFLNVGKVIQIS